MRIPTPQLATATEQPQTDNIDLLTTHDQGNDFTLTR